MAAQCLLQATASCDCCNADSSRGGPQCHRAPHTDGIVKHEICEQEDTGVVELKTV